VLDALVRAQEARAGNWLVASADIPDGNVAAIELLSQLF
jgi:hypothetical protein